MKGIMLITTACALALVTSPAWGQPVDHCGGLQNPGSIEPGCAELVHAISGLPCGISGQDSCSFEVDQTLGCFGSVGVEGETSWIAFRWQSVPPDCSEVPSVADCDTAEASVPRCTPPRQDVRTCPDQSISGYEPCAFNCDDRRPEQWMPTCRAVALMEWGWEEDPTKTAAGGFLSVGALLPRQAGDVRRLDAIDVLAPSMPLVQADDAVLTPASHSPRWGAQNGPMSKWGEISTDWDALESVGICINPQGLVYSPFWDLLDYRFERRGLLVLCSGTAADPTGADLRPYFNSFEGQEWRESGLRFSDLWPRLQQISAYDVVCIDHIVADERLDAIRGMLAASGK